MNKEYIMDTLNFSIAILSLLLGIYNSYVMRKRITVNWGELRLINADTLYFGSTTHPYRSVSKFYMLDIDIINNSPSNISYFYLRAFNPKININYNIANYNALPDYLQNTKPYIIIDNYTLFPNIPDKLYGSLNGNSFTRLTLLIYDSPICPIVEDDMVISFALPDTSLMNVFANPFNKAQHFKRYKKSFSIKSAKNTIVT